MVTPSANGSFLSLSFTLISMAKIINSINTDIRVNERDWKLPYLYIDFVYH